MTPEQGREESPSIRSGRNRGSIFTLEFGEDKAFELALRQRINNYFQQDAGCSEVGNWRMYLKTAIVLAAFITSYVLLVFVAESLWLGLLLVVALGVTTAGIGFNIAHDGGHRAYSKSPRVNKIMAMSMDLAGGSSYVWFWKHAVIHHNYVNITGYDTDIDLGILGRLSPHQKWLPYYRWQHIYIWFLYGFLAVKWEFVDDFRNIISGRIGKHRFPRPKGWDLVIFIAGKAVFLTWALGIPLLFHPPLVVLFFYILGVMVLGVTLSLVFQLPHCVEQATFPLPGADSGRIESPWAVHQARVTANYGWHSLFMGWFIGGLNYHLEHHLFPTVCHIHYPALTKIVEKTCSEYGIEYLKHRSFWTGIAAHYRWLKKMGLPQATAS